MALATVLQRMHEWDAAARAEALSPRPQRREKETPHILEVQVTLGTPPPAGDAAPTRYHLNPRNLESFCTVLQCNSGYSTKGTGAGEAHGAAPGRAAPGGGAAEEREGDGGAGEEGTSEANSVGVDVLNSAPQHCLWCSFAWDGTDGTASRERAAEQLGTLMHLMVTQEPSIRIRAVARVAEGDALLQAVQYCSEALLSKVPAQCSRPIEFEFQEGRSPGAHALGVDWSKFQGSVPRGDSEDLEAKNCWTLPKGAVFQLKAESFFEDSARVEVTAPQCHLVAVDWLHSPERMSGVAGMKGRLVERVRAKHGINSPYFVAVNLQVPAGSNSFYSLVFYFAAPADSPCFQPGTLLHRFIHDEDDAFRASRLGLIPAIPAGPWLVRSAVGSNMVVTLGESLALSFVRGEGFFEVDVNMGTSSVVSGILGLVIPCMSMLTIDMGFFVKAEEGDRLPEPLFGAVRCCNLEQASAVELHQAQ